MHYVCTFNLILKVAEYYLKIVYLLHENNQIDRWNDYDTI